mgnify:CR=1 FL=1
MMHDGEKILEGTPDEIRSSERVHVLQDVPFHMGREPLGMVGRNGMEKSTLVKAIVGCVPVRSGSIKFEGKNIVGRQPYQVSRAGIAYLPQGGRIIPSLNVHGHLTMVGAKKTDRWIVPEIYELFPRLAERRRNSGGELSGGEQQMPAIGRALLSNPRLAVMEEPSEGLVPAVVDHLARCSAMSCRRAGPCC